MDREVASDIQALTTRLLGELATPPQLKKLMQKPEKVNPNTLNRITALMHEEGKKARERCELLSLLFTTSKDEIGANLNSHQVLVAQAEFEVSEFGCLKQWTLKEITDQLLSEANIGFVDSDMAARLHHVLTRHREYLLKELGRPLDSAPTTPNSRSRNKSAMLQQQQQQQQRVT
eukprot:c18452_g1_i1.p1 GENE.c18452_g1_i1~~c18452_g1_i1.p1  ORF type:complete len:191 (+),score=38.06 c18452_g1_i1:51-575(+)